MARQVKRFAEHSQRWQREARRKGIDPGKWDRWRTLSSKSRRATSPVDYASGTTIREQIRIPLINAAAAKVIVVHTNVRGARRESGDPIKLAAVRRNLGHKNAGMTNAKLRRVAGLSPQKLAREIDDSLSRSYSSGDRSPFWYEKRG